MDVLQSIVNHAPNLIGLGVTIVMLWRVNDQLSVRLTGCEERYERLVKHVLDETDLTTQDIRRIENGQR